ncbi:MAG TPA: hypothetical protein DCX07_10325 [Phycisphaerales bacterium]|nr:hypothetical protein [Phycisphaerales bacterium]
MDHSRFHWLEKLQVQLATAAALIVVYFTVWPLVRPWDPHGPVTFLAGGGYAQLAAFAAVVWALAAACAVLTTRARPEGSLLAAVVGAGGISLRSPQVRSLLWREGDHLRVLFAQFLVEVLLLAAVLVGAIVIVSVVRIVVARVRPQWMWRSPLSRRKADRGASPGQSLLEAFPVLRLFLVAPTLREGQKDAAGALPRGGRDRRALNLPRLGLTLLVNEVLAIALILMLLRSGERGQILFALFAAFAVSAFAAQQLYPTRLGIAVWACPMLTALLFYAYGAFTSIDSSPNAWSDVPYFLRALPVDWLTAGVGGALAGSWGSVRVHEFRHLSGQDAAESQG